MIETNKMRNWAELLGNNMEYTKGFLNEAADEIDRQNALIAKYKEALEIYSNPSNWDYAYVQLKVKDWFQPDGNGWEIAENALKGE